MSINTERRRDGVTDYADAPTPEPQAYREMTPNEIRYDELAQLFDFVSGDPIDGEPSKKQIREAIKHRMADLVPVSAEVTAEQPSEPEPPDIFAQLITDMAAATDRIQVAADRSYLAEAVATGIELIKMSLDLTDERTYVSRFERQQLGNAIARRLTSVIKDPRWEE